MLDFENHVNTLHQIIHHMYVDFMIPKGLFKSLQVTKKKKKRKESKIRESGKNRLLFRPIFESPSLEIQVTLEQGGILSGVADPDLELGVGWGVVLLGCFACSAGFFPSVISYSTQISGYPPLDPPLFLRHCSHKSRKIYLFTV